MKLLIRVTVSLTMRKMADWWFGIVMMWVDCFISNEKALKGLVVQD